LILSYKPQVPKEIEMFVKVANTTQSEREHLVKVYSMQFFRWQEGRRVEYCLTPEEIEAKVREKIGDCQFLEASYEPLRVKVHGCWSPSKKLLTTGVCSGDDSAENEIPCSSLAQAERLLAKQAADWAKIAEANL
jgi:hypothetical protein